MKYVVCPICGKRLCKCAEGSNLEISCPKCNTILNISLDEELMIVTRSKNQP